jgi:hypothetical protein
VDRSGSVIVDDGKDSEMVKKTGRGRVAWDDFDILCVLGSGYLGDVYLGSLNEPT